MFALIESRRGVTTRDDWTSRITSAAVHALLVTAAVVATRTVAVPALPPIIDVPVYLPPTAPGPLAHGGPLVPPAAPPAPVVPAAPVDVPIDIPPPGPVAGVVVDDRGPVRSDPLLVGPHVVTGGPPTPIDARSADEPPVVLAHPEPRYPELLRQAGVEGRVVVEAVIDTLGRAEPASLRVVSGADPLFNREAVAVVLASRYRPGRADGRAVRVRILLPVTFSMRS